jgi:hypothetical protein
MTDVRLTATNPEDSSVVPVACNSRGELLIEEVVIEQIDNDVTIDGALTVRWVTTTRTDNGEYVFGSPQKYLLCRPPLPASGSTFYVDYDGSTRWRPYDEQGARIGTLFACTSNALQVTGQSDSVRWFVDWNGNQTARDVLITVDPDDASNWQPTNGDEEAVLYTGPVISVREELVFLRAQVRALMERLKMTPEGGWPVWDGSDET